MSLLSIQSNPLRSWTTNYFYQQCSRLCYHASNSPAPSAPIYNRCRIEYIAPFRSRRSGQARGPVPTDEDARLLMITKSGRDDEGRLQEERRERVIIINASGSRVEGRGLVEHDRKPRLRPAVNQEGVYRDWEPRSSFRRQKGRDLRVSAGRVITNVGYPLPRERCDG